MKTLITLLSLAATLSVPSWAARKTVVLSASGMTCAVSPMTDEAKVVGVEKVDVAIEKHEVVMTFNDAKANSEAVTNARKDAGLASTIKQREFPISPEAKPGT